MKKCLIVFSSLWLLLPTIILAKTNASDYCDGTSNCAYCEYEETIKFGFEPNFYDVSLSLVLVYKNDTVQAIYDQNSNKCSRGYCNIEPHLTDKSYFKNSKNELQCPTLGLEHMSSSAEDTRHDFKLYNYYLDGDSEYPLKPNSNSVVFNVTTITEEDNQNNNYGNIPVCKYSGSLCGYGGDVYLYTKDNNTYACGSNIGLGMRININTATLQSYLNNGNCPTLYQFEGKQLDDGGNYNDVCDLYIEEDYPYNARKLPYGEFVKNPYNSVYCSMNSSPSIQDKPITDDYKANLDYGDLCANEGIKDSFVIIGRVIQIIKWIVPFIIIILGMIDFGKAITSDDEKATNKALTALVKRLLSGVIIFFIPTIVLAILNLVDLTKGIENSTRFGGCTRCLFNPDECEVNQK